MQHRERFLREGGHRRVRGGVLDCGAAAAGGAAVPRLPRSSAEHALASCQKRPCGEHDQTQGTGKFPVKNYFKRRMQPLRELPVGEAAYASFEIVRPGTSPSGWRVSGRVRRMGASGPQCLDASACSGSTCRGDRGAAGASGGRRPRRRSTPPAAGRGRGRGEMSPFAKEALAVLRAPLDRLTPVTDAMLRNPPPGDWLHWRRTYDGWAHSPLTQINRDTVKDLKVAWTWSLNSGAGAVNEITPLVHDGVMFMWNFGETVQALDAKTGTLLWQYTHVLPTDYPSLPGFFRTKRSLAIGGNKLIVPTIDMRVIALDVKTGTKVWDVTDDYKSLRTYNSGPLVIKDKVLVGAGNCSPGTRIQRPGPMRECSRRADASSPLTISRPERNCGDSTPSPRRTSLAETPGTTCRTRSAAVAPSGWSGSTTRS